MKVTVTPVRKKFGKYQPGEPFELPQATARVLIKMNRLEEYKGQTYQTRDMRASVSVEVDSAGTPWDAKLHTSTKLKNSDGTWRKRPVRQS